MDTLIDRELELAMRMFGQVLSDTDQGGHPSAGEVLLIEELEDFRVATAKGCGPPCTAGLQERELVLQ
ncbi:hypothetical protein [Streptacidiphilus neutrinimicus]|uniref:hypothetical protein n=1 Tax=Streptacidiphilus neutrinimicus TaxID=105420 RepID=UPI0005A8B841|nr:hypothetical protein [Streptacidiphilus neutrinimicus]